MKIAKKLLRLDGLDLNLTTPPSEKVILHVDIPKPSDITAKQHAEFILGALAENLSPLLVEKYGYRISIDVDGKTDRLPGLTISKPANAKSFPEPEDKKCYPTLEAFVEEMTAAAQITIQHDREAMHLEKAQKLLEASARERAETISGKSLKAKKHEPRGNHKAQIKRPKGALTRGGCSEETD